MIQDSHQVTVLPLEGVQQRNVMQQHKYNSQEWICNI